MKTLSEALITKKSEFFVETFLKVIEGSGLYIDNIEKILLKMDMELLRDLNEYLKRDDKLSKDYLPYEINNDKFLNKDNKIDIIKNIGEFILKFIVV